MNTTAENAIHAWVTQASGVAADLVLWEGRHPYPSSAWILMRVFNSGTFGKPWTQRTPAVDDQVEYKVQGLRQMTLQLQAINGEEGGEASSVALLELVLRKRYLPSIAQALSVGGVGVLNEGPVQWVPASRSGNEIFESRAIVEIAITLAEEVSELGPAIKHVEVERNVGFGAETTWVPDPPASET